MVKFEPHLYCCKALWLLNATNILHNISFIQRQSYFFMEEMGGVSGKNQRPSCSELLTTLSLKTISNSPRHEQELNTFVVIRLTYGV